MGEIVGLCIGSYEFLSRKNTFGDLLSIFSQDDLTIEEVFDKELDESITRRYFTTTVNNAKMCLDVMGHTTLKAKSLFEYHKKNYLDYLEDDFDDEVDSDNIEREYTFENWARAVKKYSSILVSDIYENGDYISLEKCRGENNSLCEKIVLDSLPHCKDDTYFGIDFYYLDEEIGSPWDVFRIILEAFKSEDIITLDYTNLFEGGWCDEVPEEKEYLVSKTVILTEGSTDLWTDDTLTTDYAFEYLSKEELSYMASYRNFGKVGCFKGFDAHSFAFNSKLPENMYEKQFERFERYVDMGLDIYGYVTLTSDNYDGIEEKMGKFVDRLQKIHPILPLRTVPLKIFIFTPTGSRLNDRYSMALENQTRAIKAWKVELSKRYSKEQLAGRISDNTY